MADTPADTQVRPFTEFLTEQRRGMCHSELTEKLHDLVAAVAQHGKGGTLTLTLAVKPAARNDYDTVVVTDKVTLKAPEGEQPESIFFVDPATNDLVRYDPRQQRIPIDREDVR